MTSNPAGINCGTDCSEAYNAGTILTLTASPAVGSVFIGWSGGGCSGTGTCAVSMSANATITATFKGTFTVSVVKAGIGSGTVTSFPAGIDCGTTCSAIFTSTAFLNAVPASGSLFIGWSSGGCDLAPSACVVSATATVTANFSNQSLLTVIKPGTGSGIVTSNLAGISCGGACAFAYTTGTSVTLKATADPGSTFAGWSGGGCSGTGTCSVTVSDSTLVTAAFNVNVAGNFALSVAWRGSASGTISSAPAGISCGSTCAAIYPSGTSVTLNAAAGAGARFTQWQDACGGSGGCGVDMVAARRVGAVFSAVYTDPFLAAGMVAKAVHLLELRAAVNMLRAQNFGLPAFAFTDAAPGAGTPIRAVHIRELRSALDEAYAGAGLLAPTYTDSTITPGVTTIKAAHITELRAAISTLDAIRDLGD